MDKVKRILALSVFSISFALVEAVVVYYLRTVLGFEKGMFANQSYSVLLNLNYIIFLSRDSVIIPNPTLSQIEFFRESATILMLFAVSYLSGRNLREKLAAFLITFSLWDLFYYVFLKVLSGWPNSVFDIDVFFLIPVAWIGPVITPLVISLVMLASGITLMLWEKTLTIFPNFKLQTFKKALR